MQPLPNAAADTRTQTRQAWTYRRFAIGLCLAIGTALTASSIDLMAQDAAKPGWVYSADQLRPFWRGHVMEGESVLFVQDEKTGEARASVLFPIDRMLSVRNSTGEVRYEEGRDYVWKPGSRAIVVPAGSRIVVSKPDALRRPAGSQKYRLTHRDGNGEVYFGALLEYQDLQTIVSYSHAPDLWKTPVPKFDAPALPNTLKKLQSRDAVKIVVLGDSISSGCNASGWADGKPFQPAYPDLVGRMLHEKYKGPVEVSNLSIGGKDSAWGLTMVDTVAEAGPDLVLIAFGMNDSAGRPAAEFQAKIAATIQGIREKRPGAEFILIATMVGNPAWVTLKQELFPQYRDALAKLCGPGVALADVTTIWGEFHKLKHDWDHTGNGVNHPNDFGHRVYAQVIGALLIPEPETGKGE